MGRAHALGPGNHNKAVVLEVSIGARWVTAVGSIAHPGQGLPLPSIEADLDIRLMGVHEGQLRPQLRLIPRDDDETRKHWLGLLTGVQDGRQCPSEPHTRTTYATPEGRASTNEDIDCSPPGLIPVPLTKGCVLLLPEREYTAGIRRGKWGRRTQAMAARAALPQRPGEEQP